MIYPMAATLTPLPREDRRGPLDFRRFEIVTVRLTIGKNAVK